MLVSQAKNKNSSFKNSKEENLLSTINMNNYNITF